MDPIFGAYQDKIRWQEIGSFVKSTCLITRARAHILQYRILLHPNAKYFVINVDSNVPTNSSTQFFILVLSIRYLA